jgi:hypothetical protein
VSENGQAIAAHLIWHNQKYIRLGCFPGGTTFQRMKEKGCGSDGDHLSHEVASFHAIAHIVLPFCLSSKVNMTVCSVAWGIGYTSPLITIRLTTSQLYSAASFLSTAPDITRHQADGLFMLAAKRV